VVETQKLRAMVLLIILGILALYGAFSIAKDIGKHLKRQREAQEEAHKIIKEYGKDQGTDGN